VVNYEAFHILRPSSRLERVAPELGDFGELLLLPVLWVNRQGGRTVLDRSDYARALKKLFVLYVRRLMADAGISGNPLGELSPAEEVFDEWWELETFDGYDEYAVDVLNELERSQHLDASSLEELRGLRGIIR